MSLVEVMHRQQEAMPELSLFDFSVSLIRLHSLYEHFYIAVSLAYVLCLYCISIFNASVPLFCLYFYFLYLYHINLDFRGPFRFFCKL